MEKIKICFILDSIAYGGANKLTIETAYLLNKKVFDVTVILLSDRIENECSLPQDIKFEFLNLKNYKGFSKIKFIANRLSGFHILHPVLENSMLLTSLAKLFYLRKVSLITTIHGIETPIYIDDIFLKDFLKKNWTAKYFFINKYLQPYFYKLFNNIITVSESTRKYMILKRKVSLNKIETIYHGIDISKFISGNNDGSQDLRSRLGFSDKDYIIGYVGRLTFAKGLEYLADQMRDLNNWNSNIKFLFVGDGEIKNFLKNKIKANNLDTICKINDFTNSVKDFYMCMDLVILPSFSEGIPISLLESMLMKRITLSSDAGGIPELIVDNVNGFLFNKGNFSLMAEKIKYIYNYGEGLNHIKENAYTTVHEKFDLKKNVSHIEEILTQYFEMNQ